MITVDPGDLPLDYRGDCTVDEMPGSGDQSFDLATGTGHTFSNGTGCFTYDVDAPLVSLTTPDIWDPWAEDEGRWLTGQLLVATPDTRYPRFKRTVIYMIKHDADGAMGLIVNRPLGREPMGTLMDRLGVENDGPADDITVHYGGPVEEGLGFVLHTSEYGLSGTVMVADDVAFTARIDVLRDIADGKGPRHSLLMFGYAGWGPGQLEGEFARGSWAVAPASEALVFDDKYETKWRRAYGVSDEGGTI